MPRPWRRRALLLALTLVPALGSAALAQGFTPAQRAEIIEILRQALREDPTILRDAIGGLEQAEQAARAEAQRQAIVSQADALFRDPADPVKGNPEGDLTVVEFFDARCGYCKQLHPTMEALLRRDRNLRVVMKDLPILGPASVVATRALLAAQRQGRYGPFYDALMALRVEPTEAVLRQQAERVGLDWARLRRDMADPALQARIEANLRLAQALGVDGTPALVIGRTLVPGAVDLPTLERLVAEARAGR
ncbi:DsbA family protein [Falsiroseomonas selenitidurans]|uniref:DsbA family protein n=1 Tax=Falsiroseomonas selenitidurans TaxID=2716335 RepID=A0ABX1E879_9PROT|nr:DsbA family protein [Falsiroseomonas selenitidurans]NKC32998.1 DsbA family protein [Falsiroseomonas selenitidurans]